MKTKLFALAVSIFMIAFAVNSTVMAQNKETKKTGKTIKQTEQKVDAKINNAKNTTETKMTMNNNKSKEMMKTEKSMHEKVKMNEKEIKRHQIPVKKNEKKKAEKKAETEKKY